MGTFEGMYARMCVYTYNIYVHIYTVIKRKSSRPGRSYKHTFAALSTERDRVADPDSVGSGLFFSR